MSKFFDDEGNLTEEDCEKCHAAFVKQYADLTPNYSTTRFYFCENTKRTSFEPGPGYIAIGYVNQETQGDFCRFFDGWVACRKEIEK